jgi:hypothetical protein
MKSKLTIDNDIKYWELPNGKFHRKDGPAIEWANGSGKEWYLNGDLHREGGPAVEWANGYKEWWINDIQYTEQEYKIEMRSIKLTKILK